MIEVKNLTKQYGSNLALNHISFSLEEGTILGFLGPNGAGKSTTMKMLLGLTAPTKGSFTIDGKQFPNDRIAILKEIGSICRKSPLYIRT